MNILLSLLGSMATWLFFRKDFKINNFFLKDLNIKFRHNDILIILATFLYLANEKELNMCIASTQLIRSKKYKMIRVIRQALGPSALFALFNILLLNLNLLSMIGISALFVGSVFFRPDNTQIFTCPYVFRVKIHGCLNIFGYFCAFIKLYALYFLLDPFFRTLELKI